MELVTPNEIGIGFDVSEDGATYRDNATKKAEAGRRLSGLPTLADDSGLEVPLLGRVPLDARLREAGDRGEPLVAMDPDAEASRAIAEIAEAVEAAKQRFKPLPVLS